MADQNSQFMAILTAVGEARLANAQALGIEWNITQLGVGDGNGVEPMPDRLQTALLNERRRAPLNQLKVDPNNASIIIAEQVIPEDVGGWWIREIGLYDEAGHLVAVANCPPTFKPKLAQGSGRTQVVRLNLLVSSTQSITLKIDPSVVLATRSYVDLTVAAALEKLDHKQSVRYATKADVALSGLAVQAGGDWAAPLTAGDRVLVKNQATAKDNGLYVVAAAAWLRAADADLSAEVTSGLVVHVEQGETLADTRWQLVTDGAIVLGTTALTFQDVTKGYAPLSSPAFTDNPTAPTPAQFDSDTALATTEFVQRALGNFSNWSAYTVSGSAIPASACGRSIQVQLAADGFIYLPLAAQCPNGGSLTIINTSNTTKCALSTQAPDVTSLTSIVLGSGESITVIASPLVNAWFVAAGGGALNKTAGFGAYLAANGYQKLPSGLIIQWGRVASVAQNTLVSVSLPFSFPNALVSVVANPDDGGLTASYRMNAVKSASLAGFSLVNTFTGPIPAHWFAIGY